MMSNIIVMAMGLTLVFLGFGILDIGNGFGAFVLVAGLLLMVYGFFYMKIEPKVKKNARRKTKRV